MIGLTSRQADLLEFINRFQSESGVSPSFEEMKDAIGLKSKSGVARLIEALEERGFIRRMRNRARALEVVGEPISPISPEGLEHYTTLDLVHELDRRAEMRRKAA